MMTESTNGNRKRHEELRSNVDQFHGEVKATLKAHSQRFDSIDSQLQALSQKMDNVLKETDERVDAIEKDVSKLEGRISTVLLIGIPIVGSILGGLAKLVFFSG